MDAPPQESHECGGHERTPTYAVGPAYNANEQGECHGDPHITLGWMLHTRLGCSGALSQHHPSRKQSQNTANKNAKTVHVHEPMVANPPSDKKPGQGPT